MLVPKCSECLTLIILEEKETHKTCMCGKVSYAKDDHGKTWINTRDNGYYTMVKPSKPKEVINEDDYY